MSNGARLLKGGRVGTSFALILFLYLLTVIFEQVLEYLNISYMRKRSGIIPSVLDGIIDPEGLRRSVDYAAERTRLSSIESVLGSLAFIIFVFGGLMDAYNSWVVSLGLSFAASGVVFFIILSCAGLVLSIPFGLYRTFRLEQKYGFNKMTPATWLGDLLKSAVISTALMIIGAGGALLIIEKSPGLWWLWIWLFFLALTVFMMYLSPYVIEPLFNKFEAIDDPELEKGLTGLMKKAGIEVKKVFKMDASKRSGHTNAYFTGIGRVKRIVLFDTLMEKLEKSEILSVLAHEAGHWRKRHLLKGLILMEAITFAALYFAFVLSKGELLNEIFGITHGTFYTKAVILGLLGSIAALPFSPLLNFISRRHEKEADRFAAVLVGETSGMTGALKKLSRDNLSNPYAHPVYVAFNYSHPPVAERIRDLEEIKWR